MGPCRLDDARSDSDRFVVRGVVTHRAGAPPSMPFSFYSRRELYRIVYPMHERPHFEIGRFVYEVVDCSERGIRYSVKDRKLPALGTPLGGTLQFRRGREVEITGEVIRTRGGTVALVLDAPGILFSDILAEQRYLRAKGYSLRD